MRLLLKLFLGFLTITYAEGCFAGAPLGFYPQQYGPVYSAPYGPYPVASRTRMASPSHTLTSANSLDELQPVSDCTQRFTNQKLNCAQPFERRILSTEQECQQICEEYTTKCRGYQFDTLMSQCELFNVDQYNRPKTNQLSASDDTLFKDGSLDGSYRHRRYASKNPFDEFLRNPLRMTSSDSQNVYCEPTLMPAIGTTYVQSDYNCKTTAMQSPPTSAYYAKSVASNQLIKNRSHLVPNQMAVSAETPDCLDGANPRIQIIDGIEVMQAEPVITVQLDSPDACLYVCRLNTHLDGARFPRACKSSSFDRSNGQCRIFDDAISPNGDLNYSPNANSIYFEKFCIPLNELSPGCDDVIHRIPQHTLDRRAAGTGAIVTASTQVQCIRQCISARQLGFECMSASFFFDWPSENCYLSRFTRISRPDIYVAERKQFVDYMEMAKCMHNTWQHDSTPTPWSEWSTCDENMTRTRQRNCTSCKKRKERVPCVNDIAFQREFPKSLAETELESKRISANFESARRYKEPSKTKTDPFEASLFGENDYENQEEISFFGPPSVATKSVVDPNDRSHTDERFPTDLPDIHSRIKPIEAHPPAIQPSSMDLSSSKSLEDEFPSKPKPPFDLPDPSDFASAEIFAKSQFNMDGDLKDVSDRRPKQMTSKRDRNSRNDDEHLLLKKALQEAEQQVEPTTPTSEKTEVVELSTMAARDCDPKLRCCLRPGTNEKSARLKGCVIGYRLSSDGRQVPCNTEECM